LSEKDTEVRIMKRERDSVMTEKMELNIENRKLKVLFID
jgi:regulator of replication initiation timing